MYLDGIFDMLDLFKKKPKVCFFCKTELAKEDTFTLQYSSSEGLHSQKICADCAKVFDEMIDTMEESRGGHTDTV
jgi:superfamily II helicase